MSDDDAERLVPKHLTFPIEDLERTICREVGHRPVWHTRGEPVTSFWLCVRCGKFSRDLAELMLQATDDARAGSHQGGDGVSQGSRR